MNPNAKHFNSKISPEFSARLSRSKPDSRLHAVVLLDSPNRGPKVSAARPTPKQRRALIQEIRANAVAAFKDIDEILQRFGGRRLSTEPSALGTVSVESSPAGISAIARSSHVRAVLEDQPISQAV